MGIFILSGFFASICWGQDHPGKLTSALEVRSLTFDQAESGREVEVIATVIFRDPPATIFIQDETAGTFFRLGGAKPPRPGDRVKVRGRSFPGLYLPGIENVTFEVVDHPGLPTPRMVNFEDLASGKYHYQYVTVEGIVRSVEPEGENTSSLKISMDSRTLTIRVDEPDLPDLIGARIQVSGLAAGEINSRRQLVQPYIRVKQWQSVKLIEQPIPKDKIPAVTPRELLTFQVEKREASQVRMTGQVTARFGNKLYLRSEEQGFIAELLASDNELKIADQVEIIGFPEMRGFSAVVADSILANRSSGESPPAPIQLSWKQLKSGDFDSNLISFSGNLKHWYRTESSTHLAVTPKDASTSIQVRIPELFEDLTTGSELRITGICLVESTRKSQYRALPDSMVIQARTKHDIEVIKAPAWWTRQRLGRALAGLAVITLFSGLWIYLLRKRVEHQTDELRSGIEQKAALEERQRIAREFHDTLEQDLAGLSLRLDAASAQIEDSKIKNFITGSRSLVARIQGETRNLVADLRDSPTKLADLNLSLRELSNIDNVGPEIGFKLDDQAPLMPSRLVHHFKMMTQEAVTNAIKHADCDQITIETEFTNDDLKITIGDNGNGFAADQETHGKSGHFGCMGMRERARKVGAKIDWQSNNEGTIVTIEWQAAE